MYYNTQDTMVDIKDPGIKNTHYSNSSLTSFTINYLSAVSTQATRQVFWQVSEAESLCLMLAPTSLSLPYSSLCTILEDYLHFYWTTPCFITWSGSKALGGTNCIYSLIYSQGLFLLNGSLLSHTLELLSLLDKGEFIYRQ